jgi:hypothetical protein
MDKIQLVIAALQPFARLGVEIFQEAARSIQQRGAVNRPQRPVESMGVVAAGAVGGSSEQSNFL